MRRIREKSFEWCALSRLINVNKFALVSLTRPERCRCQVRRAFARVLLCDLLCEALMLIKQK